MQLTSAIVWGKTNGSRNGAGFRLIIVTINRAENHRTILSVAKLWKFGNLSPRILCSSYESVAADP